MKKHPGYLLAVIGAILLGGGVALGTVTYRSAIPMGTAASWSAATNADPSAAQGPWIDNTAATNFRYQTGGSGGTASYVPFCVPTTTGDTCLWNSVTGTWQKGVAGGTQGGATTASHVPYASAANTLADGELSFNSGTHTYTCAATTIVDLSATTSLVKFGAGISSAAGDLPFAFGGSTTPHMFMSDLGGVYALYFGPKATNDYIFGGSNQLIFRTAGNTVLGANTTSVSPGTDSSETSGQASLRWKAVMAGAAAASQPTCDSTTRGAMMDVFSGAGVGDIFQVCMKGTADTYAWRSVFTAP